MNKDICVLFAAVIIAVSIGFALNSVSVSAKTFTYPDTGSVSANNTIITKYLQLKDTNELTLIMKSATTFGSANANISVSIDNSTWLLVDAVSTGTGQYKVLYYTTDSKSTTIPTNPASFPYLKIQVPKVANKVTSLTWAAGNNPIVS